MNSSATRTRKKKAKGVKQTAERRMFAKTIVDSDSFLDMPLSTQALYFHLSMRADDEGFINNPKKIQRMVGASDDDLRVLIGKRFIIPFESGIVVIKHWRIHNYIQKDRYKPTVYKDERAELTVTENGAYTECIQDGYTLDTQVRLGKDSIGKVNKEEVSAIADTKKKFTPPTVEEVTAYCTEQGFNIDPNTFIDFYESKNWMVGANKMKDWKAACRNWNRRAKDNPNRNTDRPKTSFHQMEERNSSYSTLFPSLYD